MDLTDRQRREYEYHRLRAQAVGEDRLAAPVAMDVVESAQRRWWNAYWFTYTRLLNLDLKGKKILVPGCGFGEDAIRLAALGAEIHACDLSQDSLAIARQRAERLSYDIRFDSFPCEQMDYPDDFFDVVLFLDILHHVDVPRSIAETIRVLRPGAIVIGSELYTHSWLQKIRESRLVSGFFHPKMTRYIYGTDAPYITEDEHKIDEQEFDIIRHRLQGASLDYFMLFSGRVAPAHWHFFAKMDRLLLKALGPLDRFLAGRVVFVGTVVK